MNIYNFIYCFFYKLWEKRGSDGRLNGTGIVFFSLLMHIYLMFEIILDITGYKLTLFPNNAEAMYSERKSLDFIISIPFIIAIWFFYNRKRTDKLIEEYNEEYGENESKISLRILLYVIVPTILVVFLAVMRQKGFL